jgi:hypothetical protein
MVRGAVKNWFHASYGYVDALHMLLAGGVYQPGAPPVDIIFLPPDKAHDGNWGNQIEIFNMFADSGHAPLF